MFSLIDHKKRHYHFLIKKEHDLSKPCIETDKCSELSKLNTLNSAAGSEGAPQTSCLAADRLTGLTVRPRCSFNTLDSRCCRITSVRGRDPVLEDFTGPDQRGPATHFPDFL